MENESSNRLEKLNKMLSKIEVDLMQKKIEKQNDTIDSALDIINTAAENGDIEISGCCDDDDDEGDNDNNT